MKRKVVLLYKCILTQIGWSLRSSSSTLPWASSHTQWSESWIKCLTRWWTCTQDTYYLMVGNERQPKAGDHQHAEEERKRALRQEGPRQRMQAVGAPGILFPQMKCLFALQHWAVPETGATRFWIFVINKEGQTTNGLVNRFSFWKAIQRSTPSCNLSL